MDGMAASIISRIIQTLPFSLTPKMKPKLESGDAE